MKRFIAPLFILSFVGIGIFGPMLFDMGMNHVNTGCIASEINGTVCPTSIDFAAHQISTIQTLTTAVVSSSFGSLLLLISLLLASFSIFLFYKNLLEPKLKILPQRLRELTLNFLCSLKKVISWLSLFELSPTF